MHEEEPSPTDYPFNYVVASVDQNYQSGPPAISCREQVPVATYPEAWRLIQLRFPLAIAADELDEFHEKLVWGNREAKNAWDNFQKWETDAASPVAFIAPKRDAYEAARQRLAAEQ